MDQYVALVNLMLASENCENLERLDAKESRLAKAKAVFLRAVEHQDQIARESARRMTKAYKETIADINAQLADRNYTIALFNYACANRSSVADKELKLRTLRNLEIADGHFKRLGRGGACCHQPAPPAAPAPASSPRLRT